jgi:hypothetical protein
MTDTPRTSSEKTVIGWREWVCLPELGIDHIKAKIDTGARTSALHAFSLETGRDKGVRCVHFGVHPLQRNVDEIVRCVAPIVDERNVRDSGGHREWRYVIETPLALGGRQWPVEITLTSRDTMLFRMLVGRTAMSVLRVDPTASFLTGRPAT